MPYTPNNPYIPGDPYSYDLKWIVEKLKEAISLYQPLHDEFIDLEQDFTDLKNFIDNYFENLDLTDEVTQVINNMKNAGYFDAVIADIVQGSTAINDSVEAWLNANVDPVGSAVVVDSTLTIAGAAADAKTAGDLIRDVNQNFSRVRRIPYDIAPNAAAFTETDIQLHGGGTRAFGDWYSTDYIFIPEGYSEIIYLLTGFNRTVSGTLYEIDSIAYYDENKAYIGGAYYPETTPASGSKFSGISVIPPGAYYLRLVRYANSTLNIYAYLANVNVKNLNIAFIGDSLTQGTSEPGSYVAEPLPDVANKYLSGNTLFNIKTFNFGRHGLSPITYWQRAINGGYIDPGAGDPGDRIDFANNDINVVYIMLGTNGNLRQNTIAQDTNIDPSAGEDYNDYADTNCGCYCKIVEWVMEQTNNKASIILGIPPYCNDASYYNKIEQSTSTIKALAARYAIPVIDVFHEAGINKFNWSTFMQPDGIHFNQDGYSKLAGFIAAQLISKISID